VCAINHEALKHDQRTFEEHTYPVGIYDDGEERQLMANCILCDSTLSFLVPTVRKEVIRYPRRMRKAALAAPTVCVCKMLLGGGIDHTPDCPERRR